MSKYEERCLALAMEIALLAKPSLKFTHNNAGIKYSPQEMHNRHMKAALKLMPVARLSVQREAESVKEALILLHQSIYKSELGAKHAERYLRYNGLIPPPNETK